MQPVPLLQRVSLTFARVPVVGLFASDSRIPPSAPAQLASLRATACPSCPPPLGHHELTRPRLPRLNRLESSTQGVHWSEFHFIWLQELELLSTFLCKPGLAHSDTNWLDSLLSHHPPPFELSLPGPLPTSNIFRQPLRTAPNIITDAGRRWRTLSLP